tara:strand:+ start:2196 stop:2408 length:213 start_codon:yes stop_codon:yes gene_type:complete
MQKDLIDYFILECKQKQEMKNLYESNVKNMNTYFKPSFVKEETNMYLGITAPFYNTLADRLANHKNNINE